MPTAQIPPGFERCPVCGEYNGSTAAKNLHRGPNPPDREDSERIISVSCLCRGIPCPKCGKNLIHRPISNQYDEATNTVEHWPYFSGMCPCPECRSKEKQASESDVARARRRPSR
jgi:hypothetical protein